MASKMPIGDDGYPVREQISVYEDHDPETVDNYVYCGNDCDLSTEIDGEKIQKLKDLGSDMKMRASIPWTDVNGMDTIAKELYVTASEAHGKMLEAVVK